MMDSSPQKRTFALEKYFHLHSQHAALQKHIRQMSISLPTTPVTSPSQSPNRHGSLSSSSPLSPSEEDIFLSPPSHVPHHQRCDRRHDSRPQLYQRRGRSSLPAIIDDTILWEIAEDESKLQNVNRLIKSALTELLNCDGVRNNEGSRMWVQTRLMDAENDLKSHKGRSFEGGGRGS